MSVIFSDSIFRMLLFVSLCGYMSGNNLNCCACRKVFCFAFQLMDVFNFLITECSHFLLSKPSLTINNKMKIQTSARVSAPIVELASGHKLLFSRQSRVLSSTTSRA